MTKDEFWKRIRGNLIRTGSLKGRLEPKPLFEAPQYCRGCSRFSKYGLKPSQIRLGNGNQVEVFFCEKCKSEYQKQGLGTFVESKAEEFRSRAFESIKERYGNNPTILAFIADQIAELGKPEVWNDMIRFRASFKKLVIAHSIPSSVEEYYDLIKREFPALSTLLDSTLKLYLATKPLSMLRLVEWLFTIIRKVPLKGFGIYDAPREPKTKGESSLAVGGYIPGSLEHEILVGLCEDTFPKIHQVKGDVQPYIRKSAYNKRNDLIRHEYFLSRNKGGEGMERRKFNESELDPDRGETTGFLDSVPGLEAIGDADKLADLERAICSLNDPLDREISRMRFIKNQSIREIEKKVSIKRSAISKRLKQIKKEFVDKFGIDASDL